MLQQVEKGTYMCLEQHICWVFGGPLQLQAA